MSPYPDGIAHEDYLLDRQMIEFKTTITKNLPMQYTEIFSAVKIEISSEKFGYFCYFCSKHRLWEHVRTASARRFYRVPTIYVLEQNKKNRYTPAYPSFPL